jgi:crotonobetainyl-CoA:carnitine CoA-transferase CaiB-like acyl-CoA transferase
MIAAMTFQPLAGLRVVDVTTSLAGPYCAQLLAGLGADVVKVEPPAGDESRTWGPPFWGEESALFLGANAGKRSLALDLRRGIDVLLRLADGADVFVQSLRPGLAEERGLGADDLRGRNPRLVYCSIRSFGRTGPWAKRPGYDPLAQAAGGIVSVTGERDRSGVRVGVSIVDQGTGMWAAIAILGALHERDRTGEGRELDVSLYETAVGFVGYHLVGYLGSGAVPGRHGTAFPSIAPYQTFPTRDGELMVAAGNDRLFAALCETLDAPELAGDPRFLTNPDRVAHRDELSALLAARFATADRATWLERLERASVPAAPVQDVGEVAAHEQTRSLGILQPLPGPTLPDLVVVAPALSADGHRPSYPSPPPQLGAHTGEVLREAGFAEAEIDDLAAQGIIRLGA